VSDNKHLDIKQKIELFRKWSSSPGQSVSQIDIVRPISTSNHLSQLPQADLLVSSFGNLANLEQNSSVDLTTWVVLDQIPPLSLADYCLEQAIDEMDVESNPICTPFSSFLSIPFHSPRPILKAVLDYLGYTPVEASILFDSGASASFVDFKFARRNQLQLHPLHQPIQCRGFDGKMAKSGSILSCWRGHVRFPARCSQSHSFSVVLLVTELALANVILGFPWLSKNHIFVGGSPKSILIPKSLSLLDMSIEKLPPEIKQYSDVFVTDSLSCLPPHRKGFDCEINL
jgi:hypothetical protein